MRATKNDRLGKRDEDEMCEARACWGGLKPNIFKIDFILIRRAMQVLASLTFEIKCSWL